MYLLLVKLHALYEFSKNLGTKRVSLLLSKCIKRELSNLDHEACLFALCFRGPWMSQRYIEV